MRHDAMFSLKLKTDTYLARQVEGSVQFMSWFSAVLSPVPKLSVEPCLVIQNGRNSSQCVIPTV